MARYPDGAIQTTEELLTFTEGKNGIIYCVNNANYRGQPEQSMIEEVKFSRGAKLRHVNNIGNFFQGQAHQKHENMFGISDKNIDRMNNYNDHFAFIDKEKAQAYLELAKQGWHKNDQSVN